MTAVTGAPDGPAGGVRAAPRRAATVLVLRPAAAPPGTAAVEVLLVRRSRQATFMADAYVFPGGRVDDADGAAGAELATRRAAARELFEEVGIAVADPAALPLFSHWITPSVEPKRFDTDFFLAALPAGQTPRVDAQEVFDLLWLAPEEALRRYAQGGLKLPPPTAANLEELQREIDLVTGSLAGSPTGRRAGAPCAGDSGDGSGDLVAALLAACAGRRPEAILPKLAPDPGTGGLAIVLPWDPEYPTLPGEGRPLSAPPPGPRTTRYVLTPEGRWQTR